MPENKELTEAEKREELRKVSLMNLESSLWNYAAPELITPQQYGNLSKMAQSIYPQLISKAPEQHVYEQLFLRQLASKEGAITSPYLQEVSAKIIQQSIASVKVEDIYKLVGLKKPMKESYQGKYVFELNEKEVQAVIGMYMQSKVTDIVSSLLGIQKQESVKGLEELLCEEENKEEMPKAA